MAYPFDHSRIAGKTSSWTANLDQRMALRRVRQAARCPTWRGVCTSGCSDIAIL